MIELKINPVPKPRMTRSDVWKHRPIVDRYYAFKDQLVRLCKLNNFELGNSYRVEFLIAMPDSWSKSKRESLLGKPHQNKPDLDNCIKAIQDCLVKQDQSIYYIEASKIWWDEGIIRLRNLKEV
jgi:Holliday junction resolvase RusA-like endonuclease